jgi:hypothetical protein
MVTTLPEWLCPWCGTSTTVTYRMRVVSESRICQCGAVGLGALDSDEMIDDAINIFGIAEGYLTPFDSDRLLGLEKNGVEIKEGESIPASPTCPFELWPLWFRRLRRPTS